jgi:hypothetical protein
VAIRRESIASKLTIDLLFKYLVLSQNGMCKDRGTKKEVGLSGDLGLVARGKGFW